MGITQQIVDPTPLQFQTRLRTVQVRTNYPRHASDQDPYTSSAPDVRDDRSSLHNHPLIFFRGTTRPVATDSPQAIFATKTSRGSGRRPPQTLHGHGDDLSHVRENFRTQGLPTNMTGVQRRSHLLCVGPDANTGLPNSRSTSRSCLVLSTRTGKADPVAPVKKLVLYD